MADGVNPLVTHAKATANLKHAADQWLELGGRIIHLQKAWLLADGEFLQPDDLAVHLKGGLLDEWRDLAARHAAALAALGGPAGAPNALLPWAFPPHDPLVLCFITAALAAKPKMPKPKPKAPIR